MATRHKVRAFLFCDAAVPDKTSGKITLVGVFDEVVAPSYPAICGKFAVYFKVTDLNGRYEFEAVILAPDLASIVGRVAVPPRVTVENPLLAVENTADVAGLTLPVQGRYAVRLMYNGQWACGRRVLDRGEGAAMKKKVATARTVSTSISLGPPRVYVKKSRRKDLPHVSTLNAAGRRGCHNPPAQ